MNSNGADMESRFLVIFQRTFETPETTGRSRSRASPAVAPSP
jgi:hypothetical protein